jgi:hypothetical protein
MNEILAPIYYVFASDPDIEWNPFAEADCFYCFQNIMCSIKDNFIKVLDKANCGIESTLAHFEHQLEAMDPELHAHIVGRLNIKPQFYAFRWLSLLLAQEFSLPDVISLWDTIFASTDRLQMTEYVCLSMLFHVRDELLAGDFAQNVRLLQVIHTYQSIGLA